jgi:MFS family permease
MQDEASVASVDTHPARDKRYRRKLLALLAVATFFEGYDGFVLPFVLTQVLADLGGTETEAGAIRSIATIGTVLAFILAAQADRIGRRRLLLITVIGYTAATALTAISPNLAALTGSQFIAQIFLGSEWAVAITIVVEEFPGRERAKGLGIITSMGTLGGIFVGLLAFGGLGETALSWRAFYLVGIIPLIAVAIGRRGMLETERYSAVQSSTKGLTLDRTHLLEPWKPQFRRNVLAVGLTHFFRFFAVTSAAFWWPYYAQREVGMSLSLSGLYLAAAGVLGAAGFIAAGRLMNAWGRKPAFILYNLLALIFGVALFQTHSPGVMLPVLCIAIFFGLGSGAITSAFSTETFPTYVRSRAAAWCRNAFEVPGGILGPFVVGILGDHRTGLIGSIGDAQSLVFLALIIPGLFTAVRYVQETRHIDLTAMDEAVV